MDEPLPVNGSQGPQHRNHHIQGFLYADLPSCPRNIGLKRNALDIVHDKVGGSVLIEVIRHSGDTRLAHKFCQNTGLFLETLLAVGELLLAAAGNHMNHPALRPVCQFTGHIFLHRHLGLQALIPGQISDAKTALAQHPANEIPLI